MNTEEQVAQIWKDTQDASFKFWYKYCNKNKIKLGRFEFKKFGHVKHCNNCLDYDVERIMKVLGVTE